MPSGPAAFPHFSVLMDLMTSVLVGGHVSMSNRSSVGGMSGRLVGGGLFSICTKCSAHLLLSSVSDEIIMTSLLFTGFDGFPLLPVSVPGIS